MALKAGDILSNMNNSLHRLTITQLFKEILGLGTGSARGNIHIGSSDTHPGISAVQFDQNHNGSVSVAEVGWNSDDGTLNIGMPGGEVVLQVGQESLIRVYNATGADIGNGKAVYISDAGDQKPRIALAQADADPTGYVIGMTTEIIEDETEGYITTHGLVRGLITNTYTEGLPLYLSAAEAGALIETEPEVPNFSTLVGYTIRSHNSQGVVLVAPRVIRRPTVIKLIEVSTPTAVPNIGQVYTKSDNKLYFQDGAGVEHEIAFV
jgi:hypothetical protein